MTNTAEHKAAEQSLADHLGYALPLPLIAKRALAWHLKQREDAKQELIERLKNYSYDNRHHSLESVFDIALDGFNISINKE